jgi:hypothetical protein
VSEGHGSLHRAGIPHPSLRSGTAVQGKSGISALPRNDASAGS